MALVGLLFAEDPQDTGGAALAPGGIGVVERQLRTLRLAGVRRVVLLGPATLGVLPDEADCIVRRADDAAALTGLIDDDDRVVTIQAGLVIDLRAVEAVMADGRAPLLACFADGAAPAGAERLDAATFWAGVAAYPGGLVRAVAEGVGDWDLGGTVMRTAAPVASRLDVADLDLYRPEMRRDVPLIWARPRDAVGAEATTARLIAAAQKGVLDWPARFLHPPVEDFGVRLLAPTRATPTQVTLAGGAIGLAAIVAFASGWLWTGLVLLILLGPLDGIDGKLARVRLGQSGFGALEHVLDKAVEYGCWLALAAGLARVGPAFGPWLAAGGVIVFGLAEALQGEFFRRFTGRQLDDAGRFERRFRLVAARRNTLAWGFLPFAAAGAWGAGLVALAAYAALTFLVAQARFFVRLADYGRANSPQVAANFSRTGYGFLPARRRSPR